MKIIVTVFTLAIVLLATPYFGTVMAVNGQEKLDFVLHLEGLPDYSTGEQWAAGSTLHVRDRSWNILADAYIWIGENGAVEKITKEYLSCEVYMDNNVNNKAGFYLAFVTETVKIWADTDHTVLRGTIVLQCIGTNPGGNGGSFVGQGTGEFEGVKVSGAQLPGEIIPIPTPPFVALSLYRVGTVMGWP